METTYYSPKDTGLARWEDLPSRKTGRSAKTIVTFRERATIEAARDWAGRGGYQVGVLNFASAKKRAGGFKSGAQDQEESIARASNLYASLASSESDAFYEMHLKDDFKGFYSHSMIYTNNVTLIRNEYEQWAPPVHVNVVTSAAVNAGSARQKSGARNEKEATALESMIENAMFDRMGRILKLFEDRGDKALVLGSFGTGACDPSPSY